MVKGTVPAVGQNKDDGIALLSLQIGIRIAWQRMVRSKYTVWSENLCSAKRTELSKFCYVTIELVLSIVYNTPDKQRITLFVRLSICKFNFS